MKAREERRLRRWDGRGDSRKSRYTIRRLRRLPQIKLRRIRENNLRNLRKNGSTSAKEQLLILDLPRGGDFEAFSVGIFEEGIGGFSVVADVLFSLGVEGEPRANVVVGAVFRDADAIGHDAVEAAEVFGGYGVVAEAPGLGIEGHFFAEAVRVVHEVAEDTAVVGLEDIAVGHLGFAFAAGRDEAAPVAAGGDVAGGDLDGFSFFGAGSIVLIADNAAAVFEVVFVFDLTFVAIVVHVADVEESPLSVGIFGHAHHGVGSFALVAPLETTSKGHDAGGVGLIFIESPGCDVELVGALVVHVAVAGFPEPVPVVVGVIGVVVIDLGRTAPEIPVEVFGWSGYFIDADAAAGFAAVSVRDLEATEFACANRFAETGNICIGATLGAVLDHDAVFLLGFNADASFCHVVAHGLFDVDVLSGLSGPDGHEGVPMVGSGDGEGIEVFVTKSFADVGDSFRGEGHAFGFDLLAQVFHPLGEDLFVGINQVGYFDSFLSEEAVDVALPAAVEAGDGETEAVVGSDDLSTGDSSRDEGSDASGEGGLEEVATFVEHCSKRSW